MMRVSLRESPVYDLLLPLLELLPPPVVRKLGFTNREPQPVTKNCCTMLKIEVVVQYNARPAGKAQAKKSVKTGIINCMICICCYMAFFVALDVRGCDMRNWMKVAKA